MKDAMAARAALASRMEVAELALCFGFPYADFADCGAAIAAFAEDAGARRRPAEAMVADLRARETAFAQPVSCRPEAGVRRRWRRARARQARGAGRHAGQPWRRRPRRHHGLLVELIRQGAEGVVLALINDPESAGPACAAGVGAQVRSRSVRSRTARRCRHRARAEADRRALHLHRADGRRQRAADLGPTALISPAPGIRVIVTSRKMQAYDQALFRHVGIEPAAQRILALKSSVHFRADFEPIAGAVLVVAAPGPVVADPATLPFRHLRPGLRLRPGDNRRTG
jgi:microcystin degradation protein MlrC